MAACMWGLLTPQPMCVVTRRCMRGKICAMLFSPRTPGRRAPVRPARPDAVPGPQLLSAELHRRLPRARAPWSGRSPSQATTSPSPAGSGRRGVPTRCPRASPSARPRRCSPRRAHDGAHPGGASLAILASLMQKVREAVLIVR